jgi:predicted nucleotidyltransferase
MIDLDANSVEIVKKILSKIIPHEEVRVFGSRAGGSKIKRFSDLDLVIMNDKPLPRKTFLMLKEAFEESDLAIKVDIVEWVNLNSYFRDIVKKQGKKIQ